MIKDVDALASWSKVAVLMATFSSISPRSLDTFPPLVLANTGRGSGATGVD
jgi:hypothetical protein